MSEPRRGRDRAALALDVVVAVSVAVAALRVAELAVLPGELLRTIAYAVVLTGAVALWWVWRREVRAPAPRTRRLARVAVVFTVLTGSLFFIGDQPLVLPLFVVGMIMLQRSYRLRAAVLAVGALIVLQAVIFLTTGRGLEETALQLLASALLFGFALLIAWLFAEIDRQRRDTEALAAEVRRRSGIEAELASVRERQRGARELHDGIGHQTSVIMMSLQFAERMRERDPERAWAEVTRAREQAATALADIRRLARALHPTGLGTAGIADLSALAASFAGTGLAVEVTDETDGRLLPDEIALFRQRFVQEGLTNVVRHAAATRVTVRQLIEGDRLRLLVTDDGSGSGAAAPGFGLRSLAERATELGGTAAGTPVAGGGWQLAAEIPLSPGAAR